MAEDEEGLVRERIVAEGYYAIEFVDRLTGAASWNGMEERIRDALIWILNRGTRGG